MSVQDFDLSKIKEVQLVNDESKANYLLGNGWVLLKVTETQFHDTYGALKADIVFTLGNPQ
ncbi:hypothetical protein AAIM08_002537 [Escherichia coli]